MHMRRSHYRYRPSLERPRCRHHAAVWAEYDAKVRACYDRTNAFSPSPTERPKAPKDADGYCDDCRAELQAPGVVWPPEVWDYLNKSAAQDYCPSPISKPYRLPAFQKARTLKADKWLPQAIPEYSLGKAQHDARIEAMIGRYAGDDEQGRPYLITHTNGHTAILQPGVKPEGAKPIPYMAPAASEYWVDLTPDFQLALRRVRLFANARSGAIHLTVSSGDRLTLAASNWGDSASEWLPIDARSQRLPDFTTCLSADYLDPLCGCWPVRWYLRLSVERHEPPSRFNPKGSTHVDDRPQLFAPAGTEARVLIMPMRD